MSTVSQQAPTRTFQLPEGKQLWRIAAISPLLVAPIWFALPSQLLGTLQTFSAMLLVMLLSSATISDLSQRKIYNWTTYTIFLWALIVNSLPETWIASTGGIGLSASAAGAGVCFMVMLIPYSLARGGAGDVKLATAIGALLGVGDGLLVIAFAYIVSAIAILGWSIWASGPINLLSALVRRAAAILIPNRIAPPNQQQSLLLDQPVPLAGFFLIAAMLVVLDGPAFLRSL